MNNPQIIVKNAPFKRFCMSIGAIPTSYLDSLDYYETLLWLIKYLEETIIPTVNNNGEAVSELQTLYIQLKDFVENYFANLDVQEEINNKLDEMVEDGTLQNIILNYITVEKIYNNVSEMVNDEGIQKNQKIKTLGYYEIGDLGGSNYIITDENLTSDGGSVIKLNNGLYAKLILSENKYNVKQFGAIGNANYFNSENHRYYVDSEFTTLSHDDTTNIENAINFTYTTTTNKSTDDVLIIFPNANYLINKSLYFSNNQDVDFDYSVIRPDYAFTGNFLFSTNVSKTNNNTWVVGYPHRHAYLKNAKPIDENKQGIGFLLFGDTRKIENILTHYMGYVAHSIEQYIDNIEIENINIYTPIGGNYQIECVNSSGDGGKIDKVHVYGDRTQAQTGDDTYCTGTNQFFNLINLSNHQTSISNCINGRIRLSVGNYNINNFHCEFGQIILENCEVSISNSIFVNHPENYSNIYVVNTNNNAKSGFSTLLENVGFFVEPHLYNYDTTLRGDVDISNSSGQVTLINCYRRQLTSYYPEYLRYRTLPILTIYNNEIYYCRNQIEKFLNGKSNVYYECIANETHSINRGNYEDSTINYNGDLGNTTYNIYELYDLDRKLATSFGTTTSIEAVSNKLIFLKIDGLAINSLLYIEKEVDSKVYYAIVPLLLGDRITDYGKNICGIPWTLIENTNTFTRVRSYKKIGRYVELRNNSLPSIGNWNKGDKIYYYQPEASTQWKLAYNIGNDKQTPTWLKFDYTTVS